MYLVLRPPWGGHAAAPMDAATVASAPSDAGSAKPKKKRVRHKPSGGGGGPTQPGGNDDEQWANQGDVEETEGPPVVQLSAADRAMEWRGDDVSPPPRKIDMSSDARPLEDGEIQSTITSQSGAAQSCVVQSASAVNAAMTGVITVKMVIDAQGHVTRSKVQAPHYLFDHNLLPCLKGALGKMKFPATGMPTLVTMPINLT
jgi:hypothetical protein